MPHVTTKEQLIAKAKEFYSIKNCGLEMQVKDIDTASRTVCFIGNTFNFMDDGQDILLPGCATKSITENGPSSNAPDKIQHAMFHDLTRIPGKMQKIEETTMDGTKCIYAESKLATSTEGNDALINYKAGIYNQHSIGFQNMQYEYVSADAHGNSKEGDMWKSVLADCMNPEEMTTAGMVRVIKEIKLWEISTVTFGMNKLTPTIGIKSADKEVVMLDLMGRIDKLSKQLHSGTQSDGMMRNFEIQILQIKQMVQDIFEQFKPEAKHIEVISAKFDMDKLMEAMGSQ